MSLAILLAQQNGVTVLDIDSDSVDQVNRREVMAADVDIVHPLETSRKVPVQIIEVQSGSYRG